MVQSAQQPTQLAQGWLLAGRYRVLRTLGAGESGRVLLARDEANGLREIALKLVPPAHRERLRWEFQLLRRVRHRSLAEVHELLRVDADGGGGELSVLVSAYAPGRDALATLGNMPAATLLERQAAVLHVIQQATQALCALHGAGFVHGDIKPENLIVDERGNAMLIDLGLARQPGCYEEIGGTPFYMAPELFVGQVGFAADLYALGVTLWRLLRAVVRAADDGSAEESGVDPTEHAFGTVADGGHLQFKAVPARQWPTEVEPQLLSLMEALLQQEPHRRPSSARAVVAKLAQLRAAIAGAEAAADTGLAAATAGELAARATQLPLIGQSEALQGIQDLLLQGEPCLVVRGPAGSGRSRLVREAVAEYQLRRSRVGAVAPTYLSVEQLPQRLPEHDSIIHLQTSGLLMAEETVASFLSAASVSQHHYTLVVEQDGPLAGYPSHAPAALTAVELAVLLEELHVDSADKALAQAVFELSSGMAGRACRLLAAAYGAQPADAESTHVSPSGLRALAPRVLPDGTTPPTGARLLFDVLWLCGGQVSPEMLAKAPAFGDHGEQNGAALGLPAQTRLLLNSGGAHLGEGGRLHLRWSALLQGQEVSEEAFSLCTSLISRPHSSREEPSPLASKERAPVEPQGTYSPRNPYGSEPTPGDAGVDARSRAFVLLSTGQVTRALTEMLRCIAACRRQGDTDGAAALSELAASRLGPGAAHTRLICEQADALRAQGAYREAIDLLRAHVAKSSDAAVLAAELLRLVGDREAAERACAQVQQVIADDSTGHAQDDAHALTMAGLCLARLAVDRGDAALAARLVAESDALNGSHGSVARLRAVEVRALCLVIDGDGAAAAACVHDALRGAAAELDADEPSHMLALCRLHAIAAYVAAVEDDSVASLRHNRRAAELASALGEVHSAAVASANAGSEALEQGALATACSDLRRAAISLSRLGRDADVWPALHNLAHALLRIADLEGAAALLPPARLSATRSGQVAAAPLLTSLEAEIALTGGRLGAARQALFSCGLSESAPSHVRMVVLSRLLEVALGLEERGQATALWAALSVLEDPSDEWRGERLLCAARMAAMTGEGEPLRLGQEAFASEKAKANFDLRLRAALYVARCAQERGEDRVARHHLGEVRLLLEQAAAGLPQVAVARLRAAPMYQAAFATRAPVPAPKIDAEQAQEWSGDGESRARRLLELSRRFVGERRLSRLCEMVLDAALDLSGAERGYLLTVGVSGEPEVRAARGLSSASLPRQSGQLSASIAGRVLSTGQPLSTTDARADARLTAAHSVHALSLRSVVALPLSFSGEVRGVIYLEDRLRPAAFPQELVPWLLDLSGLAAPAIEAAMVLREQRRTLRRLQSARARLAETVQVQAVELEGLRAQVLGGQSADDNDGLIGRSPALQNVLAMARRVARSDLPVLIEGESGTGKELLARSIHGHSPRADRSFIAENCSAVPETLLESTLFGHVRGAFTGAERPRRGLFELADKGTLFLDEIGEMSPAMQVRLLRVLQDGVIRPVGAERDLKVDVRLVAATHRDVTQMVADGTFREDLFYRLSVVQLRLPALRERTEDIPELVAHLAARHSEGRAIRIAPAALQSLTEYRWPGNVRQLENEVRRALLLADDTIESRHLSLTVCGGDGQAPLEDLDLHGQVAALERRLVRRAMAQAAGNQTKAAKLLGVSRYGLQKMMRRLAPLE